MGCKNIKVMTDCCLGPDFAIVLFFHLLCLGSRIVQSETMLQNECSKMFIILTFCVWTVGSSNQKQCYKMSAVKHLLSSLFVFGQQKPASHVVQLVDPASLYWPSFSQGMPFCMFVAQNSPSGHKVHSFWLPREQ